MNLQFFFLVNLCSSKSIHMKQLIIFVFFTGIFISCKKPAIKSINTNNSSDSLTYQPKVPGSQWRYNRYAAGGISNKDYNFVRLTYDTIHNGKNYQVYSDELDGNQFLRQEGNKYYQVLTASTNKPELMVLDAGANVGDSWVGGVNGSDTYTYTLTQKIPVYALDGFIFNNTIVIHQDRTNTGGNNTLSVDSYYARGVGLVKSSGTVSGIGVTVKLLTLNLK